MIIPKISTNSDVYSIKVLTGEEIIGRKVAEDENTITLSKVISIQLVPLGNGQAGISFAPYMASISDAGTVVFNKAHLISQPSKTRDEIVERYNEATGSIQRASAMDAAGLLKP